MKQRRWSDLPLGDASKADTGFDALGLSLLQYLQLLIGAIDPTYDAQDEEKISKRRRFLGGLFK